MRTAPPPVRQKLRCLSQNLNVKIEPGQTVTVYATWSQDPVTVIVDANGGCFGEYSSDAFVEKGSQYEFTVARDCLLFIGMFGGQLYLPFIENMSVKDPSGSSYYRDWLGFSLTPDGSEPIDLYGHGTYAERFPDAGSTVTLYAIWDQG